MHCATEVGSRPENCKEIGVEVKNGGLREARAILWGARRAAGKKMRAPREARMTGSGG